MMRGAWAVSLAGVALLVAGCTNGIAGQPAPGEIPPTTIADAAKQAALNLGEAGAVHYKGTLTSASDDRLSFDLTAALTGEQYGTITVDGKAAAMLIVDKALYLKAAAGFWSTLSGLGTTDGKGAAIAGRWVKLPASLLGVAFNEVFAPDVVSQTMARDADRAGAEPIEAGKRGMVGAAAAIEIPVDAGTLFVSADAPHGMVKFEADRIGTADTTSVSDVVAEVADATAGIAKFYQDVAAQAGQLDTAVDALTAIEQGGHRFDGCDATKCNLIVELTNSSKVAVRVHVKADWTGDNAPIGSCEAKVGPISPGQGVSATCTLATPGWAGFYRRANSVPGSHPYGAQWSALVLADAPDLKPLTARAAAKPADPNAGKTEGSHYVYVLTYTDGDGTDLVWKYGVLGSKYWQDQARQQSRSCLAGTRSVCGYDLVTATDDAASAHALAKRLIDTYRTEHHTCPTGQWVGCVS